MSSAQSFRSQPPTRGLFSGIKDAQATRGLRPLDVGNYVVKVDALRTFKSRKDGMQVFVADLEVVESSHPDFQSGDKVGYVCKQGKFLQYFLADIKALLAAAGGVGEEEIDEEAADLAVSDHQPLRGACMRCIVEKNPKDERYRVSRFLAQK